MWNTSFSLVIFTFVLELAFSHGGAFVAGDGDGKELNLTPNAIVKGEKHKIFNVPYRGYVHRLESIGIYNYDLDDEENIMEKEMTVVVTAEFSEQVSDKSPLLVTLSYQDTISMMKLPDASSTFFQKEMKQTTTTRLTARRTLCLRKPNSDSKSNSDSDSNSNFGLLRITIHTENSERVNFTLRTSLINKQEIKLNEEFSVQGLARNSPRIFLFKFPQESAPMERQENNTENLFNFFNNLYDNFMVRVDSPDDICMTFSIQEPQCPVRDDEENVGYQGWWQTMSRTGAMTVSRAIPEFQKGFYIVLVVHRDDKLCSSPAEKLQQEQQQKQPGNSSSNLNSDLLLLGQSEKKVKITISSKNDEHGFSFRLLHIFLPLAIFLLISLMAFFIIRSSCYKNKLKRKLEGNGGQKEWDSTTRPIYQSYIDRQKRVKKSVFIPDFNKNNVQELERRQGSYFTTVFVASLFYTIPVYQLIIHNVVTLHRTGELDLCYFNFLCAHAAGWIFDFNHVWSNIGYIVFGLAYIIIVRIKKFQAWKLQAERFLTICLEDVNIRYHLKPQLEKIFKLKEGQEIPGFNCYSQKAKFYKLIDGVGNEENKRRWRIIRDHGIPPHTHGLDQALGFALMMEGFLSAAYHLCPNQSNFQYDTNFMYIMCILGLVKVYQFRHPIHPDSNNVFRTLAAFCIVSVIGLAADYSQHEAFRLGFKIAFSILHSLFILYSAVYKYGVGYIKERDSQGKVKPDVILTHWHLNFWILPPFFPFDGDWKQIARVFKDIFQPYMRGRSLQFLSSILVNAILIVSYFFTETNFADHFLFILMGNFILSTTVYICNKVFLEKSYTVAGETFYNNSGFLLWQPIIYLILCLGFGVVALLCFTSRVTNWETVPAVSRNENKACDETIFSIDRYYDSHDYWHFLSAIMLFSGFMMLLTLDDNLFGLHRRAILVF